MRNFRTGVLVLCAAALVSGCTFLHRVEHKLETVAHLGHKPTPPATSTTAPIRVEQTPGQAAQIDMVPPPAWLFNDIACAPLLTTQLPPALRVLGSQDTVVKHLLGPGDTLVISGGSSAGLQPGQQFFVRRSIRMFGARGPDPLHPVSVHTAGWIQILAVDAAVATAKVVHACEGMLLDDYLEPFTPPMIAARSPAGTLPQYTNMGHITMGNENSETAGTGQMMGIDRGANAGVVLGQRFLVFRDKRQAHFDGLKGEYSPTYIQGSTQLPLVEVAEVLVVAVRADDATVQVTMTKDSVSRGDFIAEIR
jgi:hypothetical protein